MIAKTTSLTRRQFIKKLSLCSLLMVTGNVSKGLSYISPIFDENQLIIASEDYGINICYIGVGSTGLLVGKELAKGVHSVPHTIHKYHNNIVEILQFDPYAEVITALFEKSDLVFLAGSLEDKNFWLARDLILSTNVKLFVSIISSDLNINVSEFGRIAASKESIISVERRGFTLSAVNVVRDICGAFLLPNVLGVDYADIRMILEGSYGSVRYVESPMEYSIDQFKTFIRKNKNLLINANAFYLIISYDYRVNPTLKDISKIMDLLDTNIKHDTTYCNFITSCNIGIKNNSEFRALLLSLEI